MPQRLLAKPTDTAVGGVKAEGREEEGFEQDVVGTAGMLPEPIRLQSHYGM